MCADRKTNGRRPGAGSVGTPLREGGPAGPRRPAGSPGEQAAPGRGENRPAPSLVPSSKKSTPSLRLRHDDVGRGFLYRPILGEPLPPEPSFGPRATERLSMRAARKIKGAALKADMQDLGLITFMTFTCAPEDRERITSGELVLGREMRRTLNAMQERFRRESYRDFAYIWVAENPEDENPHVHLLTNHRVTRSEFDAFARWVESLWGHGWVKIERIRKPKSAGRYILKAVGYVGKGTEGTQGRVRGNRYGISRNINVSEETLDLFDCEGAAEALYQLCASLAEGEGVERLAEGLYLTRFGISFGAGTYVDCMNKLVEVLGRAEGDDSLAVEEVAQTARETGVVEFTFPNGQD